VLTVLISRSPAFAQASQSPSDTYREVLAAYIRGGDMPKAVVPLQEWSRKEFAAAIDAIIARRDRSEMEAAAVLQLEFGLAVVAVATASAGQHFGLGERLVGTLRSTWPRPPLPVDLADFSANWFAVAGSAYLAIGDAKSARQWINKALGIRPRWAPLLTLFGAADELEAATMPNYLAASGIRTRRALDVRRRLLVADEVYQKAIADDPKYVPAYLRRGHLLLLLGDVKRARSVMEHALSLAQEPLHKYLGSLILGAILQEQDYFTAAGAAYERALAIVPGSQTASVALSHLLILNGRPDLARARALAFFAAPSDDRSWWEYRNGGIYHEGLEWLRKQVRR